MALPFILAGSGLGAMFSAFGEQSRVNAQNKVVSGAQKRLRKALINNDELQGLLRDNERFYNTVAASVANKAGLGARSAINSQVAVAQATAPIGAEALRSNASINSGTLAHNKSVYGQIGQMELNKEGGDVIGAAFQGGIQGGIAGYQLGQMMPQDIGTPAPMTPAKTPDMGMADEKWFTGMVPPTMRADATEGTGTIADAIAAGNAIKRNKSAGPIPGIISPRNPEVSAEPYRPPILWNNPLQRGQNSGQQVSSRTQSKFGIADVARASQTTPMPINPAEDPNVVDRELTEKMTEHFGITIPSITLGLISGGGWGAAGATAANLADDVARVGFNLFDDFVKGGAKVSGNLLDDASNVSKISKNLFNVTDDIALRGTQLNTNLIDDVGTNVSKNYMKYFPKKKTNVSSNLTSSNKSVLNPPRIPVNNGTISENLLEMMRATTNNRRLPRFRKTKVSNNLINFFE